MTDLAQALVPCLLGMKINHHATDRDQAIGKPGGKFPQTFLNVLPPCVTHDTLR